jgi:hypothetical protein
MQPNEFFRALVGAVIRWALNALVGYMVLHHVITQGQADSWMGNSTQVVAFLTVGAATLGWSLYLKFRHKVKLDVALQLPANSTPADLKQATDATLPV